jgi:cysteine sulfinate desulfinase/cysteine desulfurase-like protein
MGARRGNPSSLQRWGTAAREAVEGARDSVAALVGASPGEIVFTGGGTEADDLAILGLARSAPSEKWSRGRSHAWSTPRCAKPPGASNSRVSR